MSARTSWRLLVRSEKPSASFFCEVCSCSFTSSTSARAASRSRRSCSSCLVWSRSEREPPTPSACTSAARARLSFSLVAARRDTVSWCSAFTSSRASSTSSWAAFSAFTCMARSSRSRMTASSERWASLRAERAFSTSRLSLETCSSSSWVCFRDFSRPTTAVPISSSCSLRNCAMLLTWSCSFFSSGVDAIWEGPWAAFMTKETRLLRATICALMVRVSCPSLCLRSSATADGGT
mmetsp:Transcript_36614/g.103379  ORF Transcript_36614/g.103379 Transcript_36614/m.103379 type:complete len:236 (+) Transcript_36614:495-1202(+)